MTETISLDFIGKNFADVQRTLRRQSERLELLSDEIAEVRATMLTRALAERTVVRISDRFAGIDLWLNGIDSRLNGIETRLDGMESRQISFESVVTTRLDAIAAQLSLIVEKLP